MTKIYFLKYELYRLLLKDKEFCKDISRPYFVIKNLKYKNKTINVGVPLRGNINKNFQKDKTGFIKVYPTAHTLIKIGNISGWQFTKMIPIKFNLVLFKNIKNPNIVKSLEIATKIKHKEFIYKSKLMLKRLENNEKVFGAINFDYYVNLLYK